MIKSNYTSWVNNLVIRTALMSACSICFLLNLSFLPSIIYSSTATFPSYLHLFFTSFFFLSPYFPSLVPSFLSMYIPPCILPSFPPFFLLLFFITHPFFLPFFILLFSLPLFLFHFFFPFLSILSSSFTLFPWFFISSPSHIFLFSQVPLPENSFKRQHPQIFPHCL